MTDSQEWQDLLGKDLRLKIISTPNEEGEGKAEDDPIEAGDVVLVDFTGYILKEDQVPLLDTVNDPEQELVHKDNLPTFVSQTQWLVTVGDKEVPPALEMGIRFMSSAQKAWVYGHSKFAYGPHGRSLLLLLGSKEERKVIMPPHSPVLYKVCVTNKVTPSTYNESANELAWQVANSKRIMANDAYQYEWQDGHGRNKCLTLYRRASELCAGLLEKQQDDLPAELQTKTESLLLDTLNNMAAVHLRCKEFGQAKEAATQALRRDPHNFKALCRATKACIMDPSTSDFNEAKLALAAAKEEMMVVLGDGDENDLQEQQQEHQKQQQQHEIDLLEKQLQRRQRQHQQQEKALYEKMGRGLTSKTKKTKAAATATSVPGNKVPSSASKVDDQSTSTERPTIRSSPSSPTTTPTKSPSPSSSIYQSIMDNSVTKRFIYHRRALLIQFGVLMIIWGMLMYSSASSQELPPPLQSVVSEGEL